MHVVVPTLDLVNMLSRLRPLRALVTSGFKFPIYTLQASQDKLRLIIGDKSVITASTEIFADVRQEGSISVNGMDFYENIIRIVPDSKSAIAGSKELILKATDKELNVSTSTFYTKLNTQITQERTFGRLIQDLKAINRNLSAAYSATIQAKYFAEIFKLSYKLISSYTSDMAGLSGVLLRLKNERLYAVVSDGTRLLEVCYPHPVVAENFEVILPKITVSLLQGVINEGDEVHIKTDSRKVQFWINSNDLETVISSNIIRASFPEYEVMFNTSGSQFSINTRLFSDNISNIRRSLDDQTFRVVMIFDGTKLTLKNTKSSTHLKFTNSGLPVASPTGPPFEILVNAFLLEGLLNLVKSENITIICPPDNKPMVILNQDEEVRVRTVIALAKE